MSDSSTGVMVRPNYGFSVILAVVAKLLQVVLRAQATSYIRRSVHVHTTAFRNLSVACGCNEHKTSRKNPKFSPGKNGLSLCLLKLHAALKLLYTLALARLGRQAQQRLALGIIVQLSPVIFILMANGDTFQ